MNKYTTKNPVPYDDYILSLQLAEQLNLDNLSVSEFLINLPNSVNLSKFIRYTKECFGDESCSNIATKIINHYHTKLIENHSIHGIKDVEKMLSPKEVFFLTDEIEAEKLLLGKEINLTDEIKYAFNPLIKTIPELIYDKVIGYSKRKISLLIKPYNEIFSIEQYLKNKPGFLSETGKTYFITSEFINGTLQLINSFNVFPARTPTEKFIFQSFKEQIQSEEELSL